MLVNTIFEVDSVDDLVKVIQVGQSQTLLNCKIKEFNKSPTVTLSILSKIINGRGDNVTKILKCKDILSRL